MQIQVGAFEVIDSGSVISHAGEHVDFTLRNAPNLFGVRINFNTDAANAAQRMDSGVVENRLHINLYNFNNQFGTGNVDRLYIGQLDNRPIHLSFWVVALPSNANKLVHYTWYRGRQQ